jgi:hypothetical protein
MRRKPDCVSVRGALISPDTARALTMRKYHFPRMMQGLAIRHVQ